MFEGDFAKLDDWLAGRTFVDDADAAGQTLLHNFIAWGHVEAALRMLEHGADANAADAQGATPLLFATELGDRSAIDLLIAHGAKTSGGTRDSSAIGIAAVKGDVETMRRLLSAHPETWELGAALESAVMAGRPETLKLLVDNGARFDQAHFSPFQFADDPAVIRELIAIGAAREKDTKLAYAFVSAARDGNRELVEALLDAGVPPDLKDDNDETALMDAAGGGHLAIVDLLIARGASVSLRGRDKHTAFWSALLFHHHEVAVHMAAAPSADLPDVLSEAIGYGDADLVETLLARGVAVASGDDASPYEDAARAYATPTATKREIIDMLLAHRVALPKLPAKLRRLLVLAIDLRHERLALRALAEGASLEPEDKWDNQGPSAILAMAMNARMVQLVDELAKRKVRPSKEHASVIRLAAGGASRLLGEALRRGGSVKDVDDQNATALDWAAYSGDLKAVKLLIAKGAACAPHGVISVERDYYDRTEYPGALAAAAGEGHLDVVRHLIERCKLAANATSPGVQGQSPIVYAAAGDHPDVVAYLLDHGAALDPGLLHTAAARGAVHVARFLLDRKVAVDTADADGTTALLHACQHSDAAIVELLIERGADVNHQTTNGRTPLTVAMFEGTFAIAGVLLAHGARPDTPCLNDRLPLTSAIARSAPDLVGALLAAGATVDRADCTGATPLDEAISARNRDLIKLLLDRGGGKRPTEVHRSAIIEALQQNMPDLAAQLVSARIDLDVVAAKNTALTYAISQGNYDIATKLVKAGVDPLLHCTQGTVALVAAAERGWWDVVGAAEPRCFQQASQAAKDRLLQLAAAAGMPRFVRQLLAAGARPDATDTAGRTALHAAASSGRADVIAILATTKLVDSRDRDGRTPLHIAASADSPAATRALLDRGATVDAVDNAHATPLAIAAASGGAGVVEVLATHDAQIDRRDADGLTALDRAASAGSGATVHVLLARKAKPLADADGVTPLHRAADRDAEQAVRDLVNAGADPLVRDHRGRSPLAIAARNGNVAVVKALIAGVRDTPALSQALRIAVTLGHTRAAVALADAGGTCETRVSSVEPACVEAALAAHDQAAAVRLARVRGAAREVTSETWPILHFALRAGATEVVRALIDAGADVKLEAAPPLYGPQTPLSLAVRARNVRLVAYLVAHGADPNRKLSDGKSARDLATGDAALTTALGRKP